MSFDDVSSGATTRRATLQLAAAAACSVVATASAADVFPDTVYGNGFEQCSNYACAQVHCQSGTTSISGTVYAPNGALPLPNVEIYVPNTTPAAFVDGPNASRCDVAPSGHPIAATLSDANGHFTLGNVPATTNVPVVLLAGKWRRQITVASVPQCTDTPLAADATRLPRTHLEGDIPLTAIVTGNSDSLECVMRKTGVADSEFGSNAGTARFQLFVGNGASSIDGGTALASAADLWASTGSLSVYDQVMLACTGAQVAAGQASIDSMKEYADAGGRVYLAHWQNLWIGGSIDHVSLQGGWPTLATWNFNAATPSGTPTATVNTSFVQGALFAQWLYAIGASATAGSLVLSVPRQTAVSIDAALARAWLALTTAENGASVPHFSFTTPTESAPDAQKGRVVFVDLHATMADTSASGSSFPSAGCHSFVSSIAPQEAALLYAAFDLQRCVGSTRE